jgi:tetratricopeptide (TPR) repeat protein
MDSAIRDLRAAHERTPGDAMVLNELVRHYFSAGQEQSDPARTVLEESLRVDPLHPLNWAQAAWRHFSAGRRAEAVEAARRVLHLTDRGNPARVYAAYYLALANVRDEAIAIFEAEGSALSGTPYGSVSLSEEDRRQADRLGKERAKREAEIARKNAENAKKQSDEDAKREKALAEAATRLKQAQSAYQAEVEKAKGGSNEKPGSTSKQ